MPKVIHFVQKTVPRFPQTVSVVSQASQYVTWGCPIMLNSRIWIQYWKQTLDGKNMFTLWFIFFLSSIPFDSNFRSSLTEGQGAATLCSVHALHVLRAAAWSRAGDSLRERSNYTWRSYVVYCGLQRLVRWTSIGNMFYLFTMTLWCRYG